MRHVIVAGAVIVNEDGCILCALRSRHMSQSGLWEFPGGKIEEGETPQTALVREIREELGCRIQVGDQITTCSHAYESVVVTLTTYFATITEGIPVPSEHERLMWLPRSELSTLAWAPADIPTVEALAAGDIH